MGESKRESGLSERLTQLRQGVFGARGRAAFARALGVSPSTYNYYEKGRQPPADLLARAAEVTGADMKWLLTGNGAPFPETAEGSGDTRLSQKAQEVLGRLTAMTKSPAKAAAARAAMRDLMVRMEKTFPTTKQPWKPQTLTLKPTFVPIVGRTAAGLLAAWENFFADEEDPAVLERLIRRVEGKTGRQREADLKSADPYYESEEPRDSTAAVIQLSSPTPEGILEYVDLPGLGPIAPGTFGLRVDGDSMAPRILDGDVVISRRDAAPKAGQTAIVKVRNHIGVTVKLWRPEDNLVHLVPINESYEPAVHRRSEIAWASRVLWVVRL
jgi:SOS-response transcriptional repressor LexA/transcriptional regulator with XRE-family HTH domain